MGKRFTTPAFDMDTFKRDLLAYIERHHPSITDFFIVAGHTPCGHDHALLTRNWDRWPSLATICLWAVAADLSLDKYLVKTW